MAKWRRGEENGAWDSAYTTGGRVYSQDMADIQHEFCTRFVAHHLLVGENVCHHQCGDRDNKKGDKSIHPQAEGSRLQRALGEKGVGAQRNSGKRGSHRIVCVCVCVCVCVLMGRTRKSPPWNRVKKCRHILLSSPSASQ